MSTPNGSGFEACTPESEPKRGRYDVSVSSSACATEGSDPDCTLKSALVFGQFHDMWEFGPDVDSDLLQLINFEINSIIQVKCDDFKDSKSVSLPQIKAHGRREISYILVRWPLRCENVSSRLAVSNRGSYESGLRGGLGLGELIEYLTEKWRPQDFIILSTGPLEVQSIVAFTATKHSVKFINTQFSNDSFSNLKIFTRGILREMYFDRVVDDALEEGEKMDDSGEKYKGSAIVEYLSYDKVEGWCEYKRVR